MNSSEPVAAIANGHKLSNIVAHQRTEEGCIADVSGTVGTESTIKLANGEARRGFEEGKSIDISFSLPDKDSLRSVTKTIETKNASDTASMLDLILSTQQVSLEALREHCFCGLLPLDPALELAGRFRVDNGGYVVSTQAEPGSIAYFDIDLKFYCGVSLSTTDAANSGEIAASLRAKQVFLPSLETGRGEPLGLTEDHLRKLLEYARTTCIDRRQWHYERFLLLTWLTSRPKVDPSPVLRATGIDGKTLYEGLQACFPEV